MGQVVPFLLFAYREVTVSKSGVGVVLSQVDNTGADHPVVYYSTIEKECLAIKLATQAFHVYLLGRPFVIRWALEWLDRQRRIMPSFQDVA